MRPPLIGITTARREHPEVRTQIVVTEAYVQAVAAAGGCPVLIPLGLPLEILEGILDRLDALLFTGGGDIAPSLFKGEDDPAVGEVDPDRDRLELYLFGRAVQEEIPFLGICRGLQLVNVGMGGKLFTDIASQRPGSLRHDCYPDLPRDHLAHPVEVTPNSRLASILGKPAVEVNSLHHQAIGVLAAGLVATAHAPDGIIEAIELLDHPFGLAVQWHPEWLPRETMGALFRGLIAAAGTSKKRSAESIQ